MQVMYLVSEVFHLMYHHVERYSIMSYRLHTEEIEIVYSHWKIKLYIKK